MRAVLGCVLLLVPLGGCLDTSSATCPDAGAHDLLVAPLALHDPDGMDRADPRQPFSTLLLALGAPVDWHGVNGTQVEEIGDEDAPAQDDDETVERSLTVVTAPAGSPGWEVTRRFSDHPGCPALAEGSVFGTTREGATAEAGRGAVVHTAGFHENGTLFYTNIQAMDASDWPRTDWYSFSSAEPLQVYVYDEDRSEMPPHWGAPTGGLPLLGPAGLSTQYFTTITGFNEALKGLSTSTTTVVRIPPEAAYTRAGYEDHPLYGEALVFLIQVEAVADQPCPWDGWSADTPCFRR